MHSSTQAPDFDVYEWLAKFHRAFGIKSLYTYMYPEKSESHQEPKLDPANNRTIVFHIAPKPSEWARLRRTFTLRRSRRVDAGGCLVSVALIVAGFIVGHCAQ